MYHTKIEEDYITRNLLMADHKAPANLVINGQEMTYHQLSLFDDVTYQDPWAVQAGMGNG